MARLKEHNPIEHENMISNTHEMIPMRSPSTPRLEASLFFPPWPTRQSPTVFWLGEAINTKGTISSAELILSGVTFKIQPN